jgi:hypothetical protein
MSTPRRGPPAKRGRCAFEDAVAQSIQTGKKENAVRNAEHAAVQKAITDSLVEASEPFVDSDPDDAVLAGHLEASIESQQDDEARYVEALRLLVRCVKPSHNVFDPRDVLEPAGQCLFGCLVAALRDICGSMVFPVNYAGSISQLQQWLRTLILVHLRDCEHVPISPNVNCICFIALSSGQAAAPFGLPANSTLGDLIEASEKVSFAS